MKSSSVAPAVGEVDRIWDDVRDGQLQAVLEQCGICSGCSMVSEPLFAAHYLWRLWKREGPFFPKHVALRPSTSLCHYLTLPHSGFIA
jgi:hypothetical protein